MTIKPFGIRIALLVLTIALCFTMQSCKKNGNDPPVTNDQSSVSTTAVSSYASGDDTETTVISLASTSAEITVTVREAPEKTTEASAGTEQFSFSQIPRYNGSSYIAINGNQPFFTKEELSSEPFEHYEKLDSLGRCVKAFACIDKSLMPTEKRGDISSVKPTGWRSDKYDFVDGRSLYNRSHLIGFQLTAENANECNLITGTRYFNSVGMLLFENMVADYIKETGNRVLYRVTPYFKENELVARGVLMEAKSVEDGGKGICYNVFVYNVQPYIEIDYATGENKLSDEYLNSKDRFATYVVNKNSKKFHLPSCKQIDSIKKENRYEVTCLRDALTAQEFTPCKECNP